MLYVSFAKTTEAFIDRTKTETRRFWKESHAAKFKPGVVFMGITKDFRAGGVAIHRARVVFCGKQALYFMNEESFIREGGTRYWKNLKEYVEFMGGAHLMPYVLRFEHLP